MEIKMMRKKAAKIVLLLLCFVCLGIGLSIGSDVANADSSDALSDKTIISESPFGGEDANRTEDIYIMPDGGLMIEENGELVPYEASMTIEELFSLMGKKMDK